MRCGSGSGYLQARRPRQAGDDERLDAEVQCRPPRRWSGRIAALLQASPRGACSARCNHPHPAHAHARRCSDGRSQRVRSLQGLILKTRTALFSRIRMRNSLNLYFGQHLPRTTLIEAHHTKYLLAPVLAVCLIIIPRPKSRTWSSSPPRCQRRSRSCRMRFAGKPIRV